jgi:hypothetical protein
VYLISLVGKQTEEAQDWVRSRTPKGPPSEKHKKRDRREREEREERRERGGDRGRKFSDSAPRALNISFSTFLVL